MFNDYVMSQEDIGLFADMIPDYCLDPLREGSMFGLVVIDRDNMVSPVVGILLYRFVKGYINVEWVALSADYNLPDYGADLVIRLLNKARIMGGVRGVRGRFREGERMSEYFPEYEFSRKTEPGGIYRFRLADVVNLKGDGSRDRGGSCISLSEAGDEERKGLLAAFSSSEHALPIGHPVPWDSYEQEISMIYRGKTETEGCILVERKRGELVISLLYSKNPVAGMTLLYRAFTAAAEKYGEEYQIACPVINHVSEGLVKKIVNDPKREEWILAEALLPVGTGTLGDYVYFSPERKEEEKN